MSIADLIEQATSQHRDAVLMMQMRVDGEPVGQPRHRVGRRRAYIRDDHPIHAYRQMVSLHARRQWGRREPIAQSVALSVLFVSPLARTRARKRDAVPRRWRARTPDLDNLVKGVKDAINGIVWQDDAQVALTKAAKITGAQGETPHTLIVVYLIDDYTAPEEPTE